MINNLNLPESFLLPNYADGSIANVPATVAALLDAPFTGLAPLRDALWQPLRGDAKRVVLLVIDSLGWQLVQQERPLFEGITAGKTAVLGGGRCRCHTHNGWKLINCR